MCACLFTRSAVNTFFPVLNIGQTERLGRNEAVSFLLYLLYMFLPLLLTNKAVTFERFWQGRGCVCVEFGPISLCIISERKSKLLFRVGCRKFLFSFKCHLFWKVFYHSFMENVRAWSWSPQLIPKSLDSEAGPWPAHLQMKD